MYSNEDFLIELLKEAGHITDQDIHHARGLKKPNETLVESIIKSGAISEDDVAKTMAVNNGMEFVDITGFAAPAELKTVVPETVARRYNVVPLGYESGRLQVGISDPNNFETLDALPHVIGSDIDIVCCASSAIRASLTNATAVG